MSSSFTTTPTTTTNANSNNNNTAASTHGGGELRTRIIDIHGLSTQDANPSFVSLQACGEKRTRQMGGKNSLQFSSLSRQSPVAATAAATAAAPAAAAASSSNDDLLIIQTKTLRYLHQTSFLVEVVYEHQPSLNVRAVYPMKKLPINQATNLILSLEPSCNKTAVATHRDENKRENNNNKNQHKPTIQLQVQLVGPLRPEIKALVSVCQTWFAFMDTIENGIFRMIPLRFPTILALMIPPFILAAGILTMFVPILIPAFVMMAACGLATCSVLYYSTSRGRQKLQSYCYFNPTVRMQHFAQSTTGQALLYPIGPRPGLVHLTEDWIVPQGKWGRLILSLVIDAIGSSSYIVPFLGESSDVIWAPIQTLLIMAMYDSTAPKLKYLSMAEELLPFTDFIPSATIGWLAQFGFPCSDNSRRRQRAGREEIDDGHDGMIPTDLLLKEE